MAVGTRNAGAVFSCAVAQQPQPTRVASTRMSVEAAKRLFKPVPPQTSRTIISLVSRFANTFGNQSQEPAQTACLEEILCVLPKNWCNSGTGDDRPCVFQQQRTLLAAECWAP